MPTNLERTLGFAIVLDAAAKQLGAERMNDVAEAEGDASEGFRSTCDDYSAAAFTVLYLGREYHVTVEDVTTPADLERPLIGESIAADVRAMHEEPPASTLEKLFAPGQRVDELDADDLAELREIVEEEHARREHYKAAAEAQAGTEDPQVIAALAESIERSERNAGLLAAAVDELRDVHARVEKIRDGLYAADVLELGRSVVGGQLQIIADAIADSIETINDNTEEG